MLPAFHPVSLPGSLLTLHSFVVLSQAAGVCKELAWACAEWGGVAGFAHPHPLTPSPALLPVHVLARVKITCLVLRHTFGHLCRILQTHITHTPCGVCPVGSRGSRLQTVVRLPFELAFPEGLDGARPSPRPAAQLGVGIHFPGLVGLHHPPPCPSELDQEAPQVTTGHRRHLNSRSLAGPHLRPQIQEAGSWEQMTAGDHGPDIREDALRNIGTKSVHRSIKEQTPSQPRAPLVT